MSLQRKESVPATSTRKSSEVWKEQGLCMSGCGAGIKESKACLTCSLCADTYCYPCVQESNIMFDYVLEEAKLSWICPSPICQATLRKGSDHPSTPVGSFRSTAKNPNVTLRNPAKKTGGEKKTEPTKKSLQQRTPDASTEDKPTGDMIRKIIQEELNCHTEKLMVRINKVIDAKLKIIREEMDQIASSMNLIDAKYDAFKVQFESQSTLVSDLKKDNATLKTTVHDLNNRLAQAEQFARSNNVEIQCVPEHKAENLVSIVTQLGKTTSCDLKETDIHHCTQIAKLNTETNRPRSIVVQFANPHLRDPFLASVIQFNKAHPQDKLSSSHLGIGGVKKPIYVVEHLTPANKALHAAARAKARELCYKHVWVRQGKIYMRKIDGSSYILIHNLNTLNNLK